MCFLNQRCPLKETARVRTPNGFPMQKWGLSARRVMEGVPACLYPGLGVVPCWGAPAGNSKTVPMSYEEGGLSCWEGSGEPLDAVTGLLQFSVRFRVTESKEILPFA